MDKVVDLLPVKAQGYAKTLVALLGALLTVVIPALPDVPHWLAVVLGALTVLGVYQVPNRTAVKGDSITLHASDILAK